MEIELRYLNIAVVQVLIISAHLTYPLSRQYIARKITLTLNNEVGW